VENKTETIRLLVVSREMAALRPLWSIVETNSWQLETATTGWEAMERVQSGVSPHLAILDLPRDDRDSLHVLRWLRRLRPELPILLLCHPDDANKREDAIRLGADEVLVRPVPEEQMEAVIFRNIRGAKGKLQLEAASENVEPIGEDAFFVSVSPLMRKLRAQAELLAQADVPVLILGERGSGRGTLARLIHRRSVRSGFKFLKVNCSDMPGDLLETELFGTDRGTEATPHLAIPGKLEIAGKGVILIEEITEMPNHLQDRMVNVLAEAQCPRLGTGTMPGANVRILASTSANIEYALAEKTLREDLYYRLSAFSVHVPPLRQRKDEIRILLQHFMHNLSKHYGLPPREFSAYVVEACQGYPWPGNLRELQTFVKCYLVAGESDLAMNEPTSNPASEDSPISGSSGVPQSPFSSGGVEPTHVGARSLKSLIHNVKCETERNAIGMALGKTGWNRKAAARLLKISYRALLYKIDQYEMAETESFGSPLTGPRLALPANGAKSKAS
jgi:two-component system, NtrC family, response regulator AtoC